EGTRPPGMAAGPAGAQKFAVAVVPRAPDTTPGFAVDGNVYRLQVDAVPAGPASLHPTAGDIDSSIIDMRASTARQPGPKFIYRAGTGASWKELHTERVGNDIYEAVVAGTGDYALAYPGSGAGTRQAARTPAARHHHGVLSARLPGVGGLVVTIGLVILAVRLVRTAV